MNQDKDSAQRRGFAEEEIKDDATSAQSRKYPSAFTWDIYISFYTTILMNYASPIFVW